MKRTNTFVSFSRNTITGTYTDGCYCIKKCVNASGYDIFKIEPYRYIANTELLREAKMLVNNLRGMFRTHSGEWVNIYEEAETIQSTADIKTDVYYSFYIDAKTNKAVSASEDMRLVDVKVCYDTLGVPYLNIYVSADNDLKEYRELSHDGMLPYNFPVLFGLEHKTNGEQIFVADLRQYNHGEYTVEHGNICGFYTKWSNVSLEKCISKAKKLADLYWGKLPGC